MAQAATVFDVNNFVIDRPIRGIMTSTSDGSVLWSLSQITNPSLAMSSESVTAVDALGSKIMEFERAKEATFSGENAILDLGLLAAQAGSTKKIASSTSKIRATKFEELPVTGATVTLSNTPAEPVTQIHVLNGDSSLGTAYNAGTASTATEFVQADEVITLPTTVTDGRVFVMYEYDSSEAVEVLNSAVKYPTAGRFVLEVLGADVCDPSTLIHAYVIFPSAKLSSNTDVTLSTDMTHGFELSCQQDYCSATKDLWKIVIAND